MSEVDRLAKFWESMGIHNKYKKPTVTTEEIEITTSGGHTHVKRVVRRGTQLPAWAKESVSQLQQVMKELSETFGKWLE